MKQFAEDIRKDFFMFTSIFDSIVDLIFLMEIDENSFRYAYVNQAAIKILNIKEDIIGKRIEDVVPVDQMKLLLPNYEKVRQTKKPVDFIQSIDTVNGEFIGQSTLNPIFSEDGQCKYILAIVRDVTEQKRAQEKLLKINKELEIFWEYTIDPICLINADAEIVKVNPAFEKTFRYSKEEIIGTKYLIFPSEETENSQNIFTKIKNGEVIPAYETTRITKDGRTLNILVSYTPVRDEKGNIIGATCFIKDVTKMKRAEKKLRESQKKYRLITENAFDIIKLINSSGIVEYVSPSYEKILGYSFSECVGKRFTTYVHPDDIHIVEDEFVRLMNGEKISTIEVRVLHKNGYYIWLEASTTRIIENGEIKQFVTIARDITERKKLHDEMAKAAFYDYLSGLPNRRTFDERLEIALNFANCSKKKIAVMMLDGHKFKEINDRYGHDVGDAVIKEMGRRIQKCVRKMDTVARFGGDELGIILSEIETVEEAENIARRIIQSFDEPFYHCHYQIKIGVGIGISIYPDHSIDKKKLVKYADIALYKAKESEQSKYCMYPG